MKLEVVREILTPEFTLGRMYMDGKMFAYTCEDTDRRMEVGGIDKVPGETAIPRGEYKAVLSYSFRFKRPLPELLDVPYFKAIRIHGGNTDEDTEGCILIGSMRTAEGCANCAPIVEKLVALMEAEENLGGTVTITVK